MCDTRTRFFSLLPESWSQEIHILCCFSLFHGYSHWQGLLVIVDKDWLQRAQLVVQWKIWDGQDLISHSQSLISHLVLSLPFSLLPPFSPPPTLLSPAFFLPISPSLTLLSHSLSVSSLFSPPSLLPFSLSFFPLSLLFPISLCICVGMCLHMSMCVCVVCTRVWMFACTHVCDSVCTLCLWGNVDWPDFNH